MTKLSIAKSRLLLAIAVLTFICGFSSGLRASTDINIQISDLSSLEKDDKEQQIQLSLAGRDYIIKLWPSHIDDKLENLKGSHFKGSVIGDSQSWARLSYIDNHLTGYVKAFGELLEIDTLGGTADAKQIARKVDLSELKNRTSGLDRVLRAPPRPSDKPQALSVPPVTHREYKYKGVTRIMRLSIVVDSRFNRHYKGEGLEKAVSTINAVDGLFQDQFGLAVQLDSALLLTEANDPFLNYNGNIEQVLRAFRNYSLQHESLSDNQTAVHLFSGANDIDNIIGLSWIDTACRQDGYNASVSTLFSEQTLLAAHELAHNLGAVHDDDQSCTIEYNKIMWPNISAATNNRFSNCSKAAVIPKLNASCNLDNIDIGISLDLKQSIAFGTQAEILAVTAHNSHAYRDAPDIRSATLIQDGIQQVFASMLNSRLKEIQHELKQAFGESFDPAEAKAVSGGDINQCYKVRIAAEPYFLKTNTANHYAAFKAEKHALLKILDSATLLCPKPVYCGHSPNSSFLLIQYVDLNWNSQKEFLLGRNLAKMHKTTNDSYGWQEDNFIGLTPQINNRKNNWSEFWIENRLQPQRKLASKNHAPDAVLKLIERLEDFCKVALRDHHPVASLLHGDLWQGNASFTESGEGIVFDPASYYGDRETDIAMSELFGGFGHNFYAGYQQEWALPKAYQARKKIYQLYHVINHYNLFGQPYDTQAANLCKSILHSEFS
ncbi:unnamed protein product [Cyprideis torosa]|uniref:protein-ribulosamine 3-kinase n=1 Tax=Cyprideis torosa TaxID=163714 RepID=A0A7R8VZP5_9CRUS|nr:unnamed protein product [Cyprideis torosa]CAG0878795.1 unnamed protein product [Cyprideis torosa]